MRIRPIAIAITLLEIIDFRKLSVPWWEMTSYTTIHWAASTLIFLHWSASRYKRCLLATPFSCVVTHSLYTWKIVCIKKFIIRKSNTSARDREGSTHIPITSGKRTFKTIS